MARRRVLVLLDDSGQEPLASVLVERPAGSAAADRVASDVVDLVADPMVAGPAADQTAAARSACPPALAQLSNLAPSVRLLPVVVPLVQRVR